MSEIEKVIKEFSKINPKGKNLYSKLVNSYLNYFQRIQELGASYIEIQELGKIFQKKVKKYCGMEFSTEIF